ncbi:MAG: hypothetical protein DCC58_07115 [Chloroflexi bacterium]|nr:MAG: hypothetical protein DCC58_07115 [Chloroflexota bacterium]
MSSGGRSRAAWLAELGRGFREYLVGQTEIDLVALESDDTTLIVAFERFDLALGQLADLASVYGDDSRGMLDPLVLPAAALTGEYLRVLAGAAWVEPDPDVPADDSLLLVLANGLAIDLHGIARAALGGSGPGLGAAIARLPGVIQPE